MFKKNFSAKPSTPLSSSTRKKLANEVLTCFPSVGSAEVARLLVPNGIKSAKITTHLEELAVVYSDAEGVPLFVKLDKGEGALVPSVYTILRFPQLMPILHTNPFVLTKLTGGADLMAPGLSSSSRAQLSTLRNDTFVSIASTDTPDQPWAVAVLPAEGAELAGREAGKVAVTVRRCRSLNNGAKLCILISGITTCVLEMQLHARDDFLWTSGGGVVPEPIKLPGHENEVNASADAVASLNISEDTPETSEPGGQTTEKLSTSEIDAILLTSLTFLLSHAPPPLPIPASAFYSSYVLPHRPAGTPRSAGVKDSSFKNLSKWLKGMQKQGLLVCKEERKGGELMVLEVNVKHPEVAGARRYRTQADDDKAAAKATAAEAENNGDPSGSGSGITVTELFKAKSPACKDWLSMVQLDPQTPHPRPTLRYALQTYTTTHSLASPQDQRFILPDRPLSELLNGPPQRQITREVVLDKIIEGMEKWWIMEGGPSEAVQKKGPHRKSRYRQRNGGSNKLVTLISSLEAFGVDPTALATELKAICAGSTSVHALPGASPKKPLSEVVVQGNQCATVTKVLIGKGVPKGSIVVALSK